MARNFAALVALATVGFAVGDFAGHPNAVGAIGIMLMIAVFAFLLAYLFRPTGERPAKAPKPPTEPKRRAPKESVWSGWDAEEARAARERRRERPRH
ncbi:MAG: hypothetical protein QOI80_335 [Solirubrobacteraceae bacterium]|jgi:hypothetical protein|nr:hypothetical protein [Solirubrobacteraceae bacterium]